MKRLLASLLFVAACTGGERANSGQCPAGEVCSPKTPNGLHFIGNQLADDLNLVGPSPTAIGGSQEVALQYDRGDGILIALDLPYTADDEGGAGVKITATSGSVVTVTGQASRANYLRILDAADGTLFDRKQLTGASVDTIKLLPLNNERVPAVNSGLAWAAGPLDLGVGIYGQVQESSGPVDERLVDSSMQLDLAGATKTAWDTLHLANAQPGTSTLMVTAGDKPAAPVDVVVVASPDSIMPIDTPPWIRPNAATDLCFNTMSGGRVAIGFSWTFTADNVAVTPGLVPNCATVTTTKTTGTVTVSATAGGQNATITLNVSNSFRESTRPRQRVLPTTAGDRAAM